ncbi:amino acid transporter [Pelomyxa schiedti]|nr:amino acid transporter [Pelomyxa schiedti]
MMEITEERASSSSASGRPVLMMRADNLVSLETGAGGVATSPAQHGGGGGAAKPTSAGSSASAKAHMKPNERTPLIGSPLEVANGDDGNDKQKEGTSSVPAMVVNLAKTMVGAGILSLPYAMSNTGLLLGSLLIVTFACLSLFGLLLLIRCANIVETRLRFRGMQKTIKDGIFFYTIADEVAPVSVLFINIALTIKTFGNCCSYLIILGQLLPEVLQQFTEAGPTVVYTRYLWITLAMGVLGPISFIRKLDHLKFTSTLGLFSVCYVVLLAVGFYIKGEGIVSVDQVNLVNISLKTADVLPIFVFAFTCHHNIFTVYNELQPVNPYARSTVTSLLVVPLVFILYCFESIFGYLSFGPETDSDILKNYPTTIAVTVARCATCMIISFSFLLAFHPARIYLDGSVFGRWNPKWLPPFHRYIIETLVLLAGVYTVAMAVEDLEFIISLIGATGGTLLCYILPGWYYVLLTKGKPWTIYRICPLLLIVFGFCFMVFSVTFLFLDEFWLS